MPQDEVKQLLENALFHFRFCSIVMFCIRLVRSACPIFLVAFCPDIAVAAEGAPRLEGESLGVLWIVPFAGILLSIAILPLVTPHFWHDHFGKVAGFWVLAFLVPFTIQFGPDVALYELLHTVLLEYVPFIILLLALFTVTGGVRISGHLRCTPAVNTGILLMGTIIASWMGTTGAAMLLIRPLIDANAERRHKTHTVVFFIFLVANIGGSLSPLGDPPLFLGFLKGIPFFWPTVHLLLPMLFVASLLLVVYYGLDHYFYRREILAAAPVGDEPGKGSRALNLKGGKNLILLVGILGAVLMSGVWVPGMSVTLYYVEVPIQAIVRDVLLVVIVFASLRFTSAEGRAANAFTWFPILEVAKLFAGIFLTIIPVIAVLRAGMQGALGNLVAAVTDSSGQPINGMYFWLTGVLSSFLDNAPTYLVFFNIAGGDPSLLIGPLSTTLTAISAGAVFMGANTYIGNAPNFMVRSIAEERGILMPSFFGYMLWSGIFLLPLFLLTTLVFFR